MIQTPTNEARPRVSIQKYARSKDTAPADAVGGEVPHKNEGGGAGVSSKKFWICLNPEGITKAKYKLE